MVMGSSFKAFCSEQHRNNLGRARERETSLFTGTVHAVLLEHCKKERKCSRDVRERSKCCHECSQGLDGKSRCETRHLWREPKPGSRTVSWEAPRPTCPEDKMQDYEYVIRARVFPSFAERAMPCRALARNTYNRALLTAMLNDRDLPLCINGENCRDSSQEPGAAADSCAAILSPSHPCPHTDPCMMRVEQCPRSMPATMRAKAHEARTGAGSWKVVRNPGTRQPPNPSLLPGILSNRSPNQGVRPRPSHLGIQSLYKDKIEKRHREEAKHRSISEHTKRMRKAKCPALRHLWTTESYLNLHVILILL
ncbi:hypothetical protein CRENBAI_017652 [Crenichthys baileyi]|uniref:Uncharacterized protein n=1 Tax=Crenichthys baileyi TaxID=28760 RepID=A0AAV9RQQ8_9TELE